MGQQMMPVGSIFVRMPCQRITIGLLESHTILEVENSEVEPLSKFD
jgi:hypothetical protein